MSKFVNVTRKIIMSAEDSRLCYDDARATVAIETYAIKRGFAYVNVRRVFSTRDEFKVNAFMDHDVCVTIELVTREGDKITDEMMKEAYKFIDSQNPDDIDVFKGALAMEDVCGEMLANKDKVSLINVHRSVSHRLMFDCTEDEFCMCRDVAKLFKEVLETLAK